MTKKVTVKLAPLCEITTPRLKLCAAVLVVEIAQIVVSERELHMNYQIFLSVTIYTMSMGSSIHVLATLVCLLSSFNLITSIRA